MVNATIRQISGHVVCPLAQRQLPADSVIVRVDAVVVPAAPLQPFGTQNTGYLQGAGSDVTTVSQAGESGVDVLWRRSHVCSLKPLSPAPPPQPMPAPGGDAAAAEPELEPGEAFGEGSEPGGDDEGAAEWGDDDGGAVEW